MVVRCSRCGNANKKEFLKSAEMREPPFFVREKRSCWLCGKIDLYSSTGLIVSEEEKK